MACFQREKGDRRKLKIATTSYAILSTGLFILALQPNMVRLKTGIKQGVSRRMENSKYPLLLVKERITLCKVEK